MAGTDGAEVDELPFGAAVALCWVTVYPPAPSSTLTTRSAVTRIRNEGRLRTDASALALPLSGLAPDSAGRVPCRGPAFNRFSCTVIRPFRRSVWHLKAKSLHSVRGPHLSYRLETAKTVAHFGVQRSVPVTVPPSTPISFTELAARISNWGRWGPNDQLGTLNLIDEAARLRGVGAVRDGTAWPLGLPLSEAEGIQMGFVPGRVNPTRTRVCVNEPLSPDPEWIASSEDTVNLAMQCATHWDGLAHVSYGAGPEGGKLYNGYPASAVTREGAAQLGIHLIRSLVSRGVLLDVARAKGLEILEPGYPITPRD